MVLFVAGLMGAAVFCGCEDGPDMDGVGDEFDGGYTGVDHGDTSDPQAPQMAITPASVTATNNGSVVAFQVSGASGSVSWSVQDISKGSILTQSSTAATYQRSAAGDNVVIATDSRGTAVFATVSQP
jgi:hypothetical protein